MRIVQRFGVLLSATLVAVVVVWESQQRVSPGPLHPAHAAVIELQGASGCEVCHGERPWDPAAPTRADACSHCHAAIAGQVREGRGLHGALPAARAADCGGCHVDHHGDHSPLVTAASWELAGIGSREGYRHEHVPDYTLHGRHSQLGCRDCHLHADAVEVPRGHGRFLGQSADCAACHRDEHRGAFGGDCEQCHGQEEPFAAAPGFDHGSFPLRGAHRRVACDVCHPPGMAHAARRAPDRPPPVRTCAECHDSPHQATFLREVFAASGDRTGDCGRCHDPAEARFAGATLTAAQHAATGFPLTAPHEGLDCKVCHGAPGRGFERRFRGPRRSDCRGCHVDRHRGQFDPDRWPQCTSCHAPTHFRPSPFDHRAHERTGFPLIGMHAAVGCNRCHPDVVDGVRRYAGTDRSCAACHADVHRGAFDRGHVPAPVGGQADCGRCHSPHGFGVRPNRFEHVWTGFPLVGAHARLPCAACHPRTAVADAEGRHFGRARGRACADCHADPHLGQFAGGDGAVDCSRCHQNSSFAETVFDHQRHSRYPLDDTHREVACAKCHPTVATANGPVVRYRPLGTGCGDCHVLGTRGPLRR